MSVYAYRSLSNTHAQSNTHAARGLTVRRSPSGARVATWCHALASWCKGGARAASPPLQGLAPPARRPRAGGAPWEARARAARVQTAGEDVWWWW